MSSCVEDVPRFHRQRGFLQSSWWKRSIVSPQIVEVRSGQAYTLSALISQENKCLSLEWLTGGTMPTRRDMLKAGLLGPAAVAAAKGSGLDFTKDVRRDHTSGDDNVLVSPTPGTERERLLLDFGWRFHFGHADDPSKDFGYGGAE